MSLPFPDNFAVGKPSPLYPPIDAATKNSICDGTDGCYRCRSRG
ncbi:MAG: hypothetical protein RIK87_24865 [Fuerstiella sp.]